MPPTDAQAGTSRRRHRSRWGLSRALRRWRRRRARDAVFAGHGRGSSGGRPHHRSRSHTGRRRAGTTHRNRGLGRWLVAAFGLMVAVGAVLSFLAWRDVSRARDELDDVRVGLAEASRDQERLLTAEGRAELIRRLEVSGQTVDSMRSLLRKSRPLALLGRVPGLGTQRDGILQLATDAGDATRAGAALISGLDVAAKQALFQDGRVPLDALGGLIGEARSGTNALAPLVRGDGGLWGPVASARQDFDGFVGDAVRRLERGDDVLTATLGFLGRGGDKRHLLAVQNNAEMRDQGTVLSYGVLRVSGGRLTLERSGSIADLTLRAPAGTAIPAGTEKVFGPIAPTQTWQSVNATADFAFSGMAMRDMYRQATGETIDGVIGVDVVAFAGLLRAIGPVQVPGQAEPITADNAARVLLHDQYDGLPPLIDVSARRDRLADLTRVVVERLVSGARDVLGLSTSLSDAAAGGHLRVWSADPDEERRFEATGIGGSPAAASGGRLAATTFHLAVQNRTATKLDYYVHPTVTQNVRLTDEGDAVVQTVVTLENRAPVGAGPSYQLGPDGFTKAPGDYVGWVLLWSPAGAVVPDGVTESGLELSQRVVQVSAGQSTTVTFDDVRIPGAVHGGRVSLRLVPQPRLEPVPLRVRVEGGDFQVEGEDEWSGLWDRTLDLTWRVTR